MKTFLRVAAVAAALSIPGITPAGAQAISACYVPSVGAVYLIGLTGLPTACLAASHVAVSFGAGTLGDGSVTATKLADGAVVTIKLQDGAVTTAKIAASAVGSAQIAANAVGTNQIAAGAVGTSDIADGAVTAAKVTGMPGVESQGIALTNIDVRTSAVNVATITLTVPAAGYIVLRFDGQAYASAGDMLVLAASNVSQTWGVNDGNVLFDGDGGPHPFSHTRFYAVSAGANTFYAVVQNLGSTGGTGRASVYATLTATYYPNRY